jgi:hypothetical protein
MPDDRATCGCGPAERCPLASPNDLWCADLKGEFKLRNGHFQIPHHAPRREIEATRKFASLLHFINGAVGERDDEPEFMSPDSSREARQDGCGAGVPHGIAVFVVLICIIRMRRRLGFFVISILLCG